MYFLHYQILQHPFVTEISNFPFSFLFLWPNFPELDDTVLYPPFSLESSTTTTHKEKFFF